MTPQSFVHDALEVITFPAAAAKVLQLLEDPEVRPGQIAEYLALDPPLASRVLKIANSPLFLGHSPVDELPRAVMVLGTAALRDLVLGAGVMSAFESADMSPADLEDYWSHSIGCGAVAAEIAIASSRRLAEVAFTAGLMHDLGELLLLVRCPQQMQAARAIVADVRDGRALCAAETEQLGFDHTSVGAALGREWHFPETLVESMSFHHEPQNAGEDFRQLVSIVSIANSWSPLIADPVPEGVVPPPIDSDVWVQAGIEEAQMPLVLERARERVESMQAALL